MANNTVFRDGFFADRGFDFETRVVLGQLTYGGADAGEVLATIAGIEDGNVESWVAAWAGLGDRLASVAATSEQAGRRVSACNAWLRSAVAYAATLNALAESEGIDALLPMFRKHRDAWSRSCALRLPAWEPVAIPYAGTTLPGWFAAPSGAAGRRPTLILNNGSDGAITSMLAFGGAGALERGYNVLFFDGPGQQSMLFERGVYFRHDWEAVITPIVDWLMARTDVDPKAIALYGVSQAGYWVSRALAYEHRLAAAIVDTGVVDVSESWMAHMPPELIALLKSGQRDQVNAIMSQPGDPKLEAVWNFRARPYGGKDPYSTLESMLRYRITAEEAGAIRTPLFITDPEKEQFFPGQPARLAAMTPGVSTLVKFTAAEGADYHCEPMARRLVDQRMLDWLDGILRR